MENQEITIPIIDQILADFAMYLEPKLLKQEYIKLVNLTSVNIENIEKYQQLLSNINYAWKKTLKYKQYFSEFYAQDGRVENHEALNHHIHAYLQDMDTLKNKIEAFLGNLKNDSKKSAANKEEVANFLEEGVKKSHEVFNGISKHRNPHVHSGMRFVDADLLKSENAHNTLSMFSNPLFEAWLDPEKKPELMARFATEKEESFEVARERWVGTAEKNDSQTSGFLNAIMEAIKPVLYQFLNIQPIKEILSAAHKQGT